MMKTSKKVFRKIHTVCSLLSLCCPVSSKQISVVINPFKRMQFKLRPEENIEAMDDEDEEKSFKCSCSRVTVEKAGTT